LPNFGGQLWEAAMATKTWQKKRERFPSGQREQTVNLSANAFGGSNPPLSTRILKTFGFQKLPLTFRKYKLLLEDSLQQTVNG
jgi:hypothetical protein